MELNASPIASAPPMPQFVLDRAKPSSRCSVSLDRKVPPTDPIMRALVHAVF
jgi:hypothetical protein